MMGLPEIPDEDKARILSVTALQALGLQGGSERPRSALLAAGQARSRAR